jgi:hypothetical protein
MQAASQPMMSQQPRQYPFEQTSLTSSIAMLQHLDRAVAMVTEDSS